MNTQQRTRLIFQGAGTSAPSSGHVSTVGGFTPAGLIVNNFTRATFYLSSDLNGANAGGATQIVAPYSRVTLPWATQAVAFATDGTAFLAKDFYTIQAVAGNPNSPGGGIALDITPYAPVGWGGGAPPVANQLNPIAANDPFFAWQAQQFMDLLTGVMTGQRVTIANIVDAENELNLYSPSRAKVRIMVMDNTGLFSWVDSSGAITLATLSDAGRFSVPATGASGKPLTYYVPIPDATTTIVSPTSGNTGALTGVPTSALAVSIAFAQITVPNSATTYVINLGSLRSSTITGGGTEFINLAVSGLTATKNAPGNTLDYSVSGGVAPATLQIVVNGYYETS